MAWIQDFQFVGSADGGNLEQGWRNTETGEFTTDARAGGLTTDQHLAQIWSQVPKGLSDVEKVNWLWNQGSGAINAAVWAEKNGLLKPGVWQKHGGVIASLQSRADTDFGDTLNDLGPLIVGGAMGAGALFGTGTAAAGAGLGQGALASELGGLGAAELAGGASTDALLGEAAADTLGADLGFTVDPVTGDTVLAGSAAGGASSGGAAGAGVSGGAAGGGAAAGGTALSKISQATGLDEGTLELLGIGGATALGVVGADQQGDALRDIAGQSREDRSTFLNLAKKFATDPNAYHEGPGKATMDAILRSLSVKGNPTGIPSSLDLAADASMRNWLNATNTFGNLGLGGEATQANLQSAAVGADANKLNAVGAGIADVTRPKRKISFDDIYASLT